MKRNGPGTPLTALLCVLLSAAALAAGNADILFQDDFEKAGPLDAQKWEAPGPLPACDGGLLVSQPSRIWSTKQRFSEPVSVEFSGVFIAEPPRSPNNHLALAPNGLGPDMVSWALDSSTGRKLLVPYRHVGETDFWAEGYDRAVDMATLPDLAGGAAKAINLRIDWWPGKLARYYLNGKMIAEFATAVPAPALPVGVRDESVYFRIGGVKVTRITESADDIIAAAEKARQEAAKAAELIRQAKTKLRDDAILSRISMRIDALRKQFPRRRMVIGAPNYMWGIDAEIKHELKTAGMDVLAWPDTPLMDPEASKMISPSVTQFNVIVFGDTFYHLIQPDPNTGKLPDRITEQIPLLKRFLDAGGGVWFSGLGEQEWGRSSHAVNLILKELGLDAEVLGEDIKDTAAVRMAPGRFGEYGWAEVMPDPLTDGVKNVLVPSGVVTGEGSMGSAPIIRLGTEWRVILKGSATAGSYACVEGVMDGQLQDAPKTVKSSPILCAVRQAGKGRVVLWPTWSNFTVTGGSGGALVDGEVAGRWSDGARLIENLLCWLAEPSQGSKDVGTFNPDKAAAKPKVVDVDADLRNWCIMGRKDYPAQFKGLIGAHSNLSDGASSPEAMIAAAKKAGYQFIAFTEQLAKMDEQKWKQLLAACDKANAADAQFIAYPGLDFMVEAGDRGLIFGNRYWIKDEMRSKEYPDRLRWFYSVAYQADANAHRWHPRVLVFSKTNNKRPWNLGPWSFFGAYCYEGGKLVDDSFDEWPQLVRENVYFLSAGIMAVHIVRSADEVALAAKPGLYQTYVCADNLPQVMSRLTGCVGPMGYFPTYISAGPEIQDFRAHVAIEGGEVAFDMEDPKNNRGVLHVLAQAEAGIKDVTIWDGKRLVRRYQPGGNRFETFVNFHPDSYHAFGMSVTDSQGRTAVSWTAFKQIQEWVYRRCGDNLNWMRTGKGAGRAGEANFEFTLFEVTYGWKSQVFVPTAQRDNTRELPKYFCEQNNFGNGGLSGAINGYIRPTGLIVDGKPWVTTYPAMTLNFDTNGRFGSVLNTTVRDEMIVPKLESYTIGAFSGPYKVVPCPWPGDLMQYILFMKPDGASINRYSAKIRFIKDVASPDGKPIPLSLGATGAPNADTVEVMNPDGVATRQSVGALTVSGEIPVGGYMCWYDDKGRGLGGFIALTQGIKYAYSKRWQECHIDVPSPVKAGTEVAWDVIMVTADGTTVNTDLPMEDVRVGMGIAGKPSLYDVEARIGKVADQKFFLTLNPDDGGFSGRIVKAAGKTLPIHLPVVVNNLNPRWDAAIWYRGQTQLHTPRYYRDRWGVETWIWVVGAYEPVEDMVRYIPVIEGNRGYGHIDTDKQDSDIYIGNLLVCDQPDVFISVIKAGKGRCEFEVNNPTDRELTLTVHPAAGFELVGKWERKVTLRAGGSQRLTGWPGNAQ